MDEHAHPHPPPPPAHCSRFVRPETIRLSISCGDFLVVKKRLSAGEQRAVYARMFINLPDGSLRPNPLQAGLALITAYLVDWTLTDDQGQLVPIRNLSIDDLEKVLDRLDLATFVEIRDRIQQHEEAMVTERDAEKKTPPGAASETTSPSLSAAGGASTGSVS